MEPLGVQVRRSNSPHKILKNNYVLQYVESNTDCKQINSKSNTFYRQIV